MVFCHGIFCIYELDLNFDKYLRVELEFGSWLNRRRWLAEWVRPIGASSWRQSQFFSCLNYSEDRKLSLFITRVANNKSVPGRVQVRSCPDWFKIGFWKYSRIKSIEHHWTWSNTNYILIGARMECAALWHFGQKLWHFVLWHFQKVKYHDFNST